MLARGDTKIKALIYRTKEGKEPFNIWLDSLNIAARARIEARLDRIESDNLGDFKNLKKGLYELRFHFDKGYRIYFGKVKNTIILLLCAGSKRTQTKYIEKAREYLKDYKEVIKK